MDDRAGNLAVQYQHGVGGCGRQSLLQSLPRPLVPEVIGIVGKHDALLAAGWHQDHRDGGGGVGGGCHSGQLHAGATQGLQSLLGQLIVAHPPQKQALVAEAGGEIGGIGGLATGAPMEVVGQQRLGTVQVLGGADLEVGIDAA